MSILSGSLLGLAWYQPFTFLIFIGWVPLLMIEQNLAKTFGQKRNKLKLIGFVYLAFFIWNLIATWWIVYASFGGACMAIFSNSLLFTMVFMIFHNARQRINKPNAIWLLVPIWIAWEYGHGLWDLAWTWLTLGNVFAFEHNWVQWYEYTGTSGGSLWALTVNILILKYLNEEKVKKLRVKDLAIILAAVILPMGFSFITKLKYGFSKGMGGIETVVVQPNLDPYNEKFVMDPEVQVQDLLKQLKGKINSETDYLVLPETFLTEYMDEERMENAQTILLLRDSILAKFPKLTIVTGASTVKIYKSGEKLSSTAHPDSRGTVYDSYNTGLQIEKDVPVKVYHKSLLVPGVERMPFPALFKPLEKLAIDMGGTTGSLGTQESRTVFINKNKVAVAPVICYESIFSDYVADYIRNGAQLIFIITNDGWWDDTPGYKHHLNYARLRAIETRCQVARSANTGISCFIDELGEIDQATKWWEEAVITKNLLPNSEHTFFVSFGDLITKTAVPIALLTFLFSQYLRFSNRKK